MRCALTLLLLLSALSAVGCSTRTRDGRDDDDSVVDDDDSAGDDDDDLVVDDDDSVVDDDDSVVDDDDTLDPQADSDGDGLNDGFEVQIGTSPTNPDSDGDGAGDAFEVLAYFRPDDAADKPFVGGWPRGPLPSDSEWASLSAESGWELYDFSGGWSLVDQYGDEVELRDFYGQVVLISIAAEWCPPCRELAATLQADSDARAEQGFVVLQLLLDGFGQGDGAPDLWRWIGDFGLDMPVFDDGDREVTSHYVPPAAWGIPMFAILDRWHVVRVWNRAGFPAPWPEVDTILAEPPPIVAWPLPDNAAALRSELGFGSSEWSGYKQAL